jgi:hypothetical protein
MKGEYYVWEKSENHPNGAVVKVFTSLKKCREYIKSRAVKIGEHGISGTLENGGFIGVIL